MGPGPGGPKLKHHDDREQPGKSQVALMLVAALFTLSIFGYAVYQAVQDPQGPAPTATVADTRPLPNGGLQVEVQFSNPTKTGIDTATVAVDCSGQASPSVDVHNVPPLGSRTAYLHCPPGTLNVTASVESWLPA